MSKDVMVDLETLGTRPGCKILSIGAVEFGVGPDYNEDGLGAEFYVEVQRAHQGNLHNALGDAKSQAEHAVRLMKELGAWQT